MIGYATVEAMFSTGCSVTHLGGSRVSHASLKVLLYKHSSDKLREATVHGAIASNKINAECEPT
ncbi:MAG: hypothetical protein V7K27_23720 [Nostoc sp.]|uniref:hypothetical protein n=1 Tax=Nostoc sp. TaxID=1180 RepID=UPI002FF8EAE7